MKNPLIETRRLSLRPFIRQDIDDLHRHWTDREMRKYLWDDQIISRETAAEVVERSLETFKEDGFGFWIVSLKSEPSLVGFCGLRYFTDTEGSNSEVEILYGIGSGQCGKGLATEAAAAVLRYGFEESKLERIYAGADPPNAASFRVMEKLGMKYAQRMTINGVVAIYFVIGRESFQYDNLSYQLEIDRTVG